MSLTFSALVQKNFVRKDLFQCANCHAISVCCDDCSVGNVVWSDVSSDRDTCMSCASGREWEDLSQELAKPTRDSKDLEKRLKAQEELLDDLRKVSMRGGTKLTRTEAGQRR